MKNGRFAVIYVGSSSLSMQISEFTKGNEKPLESLNKYISLGTDTFSKKVISLEKIEELSSILQKFKHKLDEYGIKSNYSALCTSAVRESKNKLFVIDKVRRNTGIELKILSDTDEMYIKYLGSKHSIKQFCEFEKDGILFTNISSGTVTIKIIQDEKLIFSDALPYGSLRLYELFRNTDELHKSRAYSQYIENMVNSLWNTLGKELSVKRFVSSGSSVTLLQHILMSDNMAFKQEDLQSLYKKIKNEDTATISNKYKLSDIQAQSLLPTLITYLNFFKITGQKVCHFTNVSFVHMLVKYYSNNLSDKGLVKRFRSMLKKTGQKYNYDRKHSQQVVTFSNYIFNTLKHIHLMGKNDKLLLEAASIIHDTGYFINPADHEEHSYYITKSLKFPGIDRQNIDIIAIVALLHRKNIYDRIYRLNDFSQEDRLRIMKLAGILRVADSLDSSHKQLIYKIDINADSDRIVVTGYSKVHPHLEIRSFSEKCSLLEDIFGVTFKLKIKYDDE